MAPNPQPPAAPLLEGVLDQLGSDIVSGALPEGKTFTLQDLSNRFEISRTVAREAMRALEQLGLVSSSRRVGITVLPRRSWAAFDQSVINWRLQCPEERRQQLQSLNELRIAVEPVASRNAARNASPDERAELVSLVHDLRQLGEAGQGASEEFLAVDVRFHTLLLETSGNEMFAALAPSILNVLQGRTAFGLQPDDPSLATIEAHEALAYAIAEGDEDAAEEHSRRILSEVRAALLH